MNRSPRTRAILSQTKQRIDRIMHAKKEYEKAKRLYHKAIFVFLYGQNRNGSPTRAELAMTRNTIRSAQQAYMANRVLSHLPTNIRNNIIRRSIMR